jgi:large subunit ribosomal protein L6
MSRLGKIPITIPEKTEVNISEGKVSVKGPLGQIERDIRSDVKIEIDGNEIKVAPANKTRFAAALWGTYAAHLRNMVNGVNEAFEKKLIVEGVGYKVDVQGNKVVLNVGYSHPVEMIAPEGIEVIAEKNNLTIKGVNKEVVGEFAANIRDVRKPEPYKGKGIRYHDEVVRRKQGKKAV